MINKIIAFSIGNKLVVALFTLAIVATGIWSLTQVPIDAVPDITNNQVQVITQSPNLGTEDIEQFVSYPIEVAMGNLPGVTEVRSISRFGLSVVTIVFEDKMDTYLPRQLVSEKLNEVRDDIPTGFGEPTMGPISTGLGEILQYTLEVDSAHEGQYSNTDLRTMQDWIVRRQMALVPGVVEVNAFGGHILQYEVAVVPDQLNALNITITDVFKALQKNNQNTGGAYIEKNHQAHFIRGEGLISSTKDIEQTVVSHTGSMPVTIGDIGTVRQGQAIRYGAFTKDGEGEAVGGIVFMLKGANSNEVIGVVKERIAEINQSLPEGVLIEPFLDRSKLISRTTSTVTQNLTEGALIVIFVLVLLLGSWRGGLIVASTIPLSLLFAFIMMHVFDVWANLMSLGAIDFGIIIDGAVIIVEGTVYTLTRKLKFGKHHSQADKDKVTLEASTKMMRSAFFGQLIILIVFIPILALEGVEGKMFKPMALTFMFAMIGVMILCLTYVPMMSAWFLRPSNPEKLNWGDRFMLATERSYEKILTPALSRGRWIVVGALVVLGLAAFTFTRMGGEFIPQLDEGDIAFHILLQPGSSLSEAVASSTEIERILLDEFPEVEHAMTRFGVADVPTDPMPMDVGDCFIILKPKSEWVSATNKAELIEKIKVSLAHLPGLNFEFSQPIEMRFNELISGVREDVAVKIFGEDLDTLALKAEELGRIVANIEGVGDMMVEATTGLPQMTVEYSRPSLARYNLSIQEVNQAIESAFSGGHAGVVFDGERRFDLVVRLAPESRRSIDDLKDLYLPLSDGTQIPLSTVAQIAYKEGPMQISRDNTHRRVYVGINVRNRDVQSLVEEIQQKVQTELDLPPGYHVQYGGAFENLERASARLQILVPVAMALIFILIFFALRSVVQTTLIYMAIPFAAIGGVFALWLRDMPFSISAGIGFIVLFGVAVLNGLVLISSWNDMKQSGVGDIDERIKKGATRRVRPILLTALTDILGFLPMALSASAGAEVQRPLATVVIGGMFTATILTLFILPILYRWTESRGSQKPLQPVAAAMLLLLGVGVFSPQLARSQTVDSPLPISLEGAINRAQSKYPEMQAARLAVEKEQSLKKTAWDFGNTTIYTGGEELKRNGGGVYTTIGIQQSDIDILGIASKHKLQSQRVALAESALNLSLLELKQQVKMSYGQLYAAQMKLALYREMDSIFVEFERAAKLRYETEETSKLAYLAAANQAGKVATEAQQVFHDYHIALQQFNLWMVSDSLFTIIPTGLTAATFDIQPLDSLQHPTIDFSLQQKRLADQRLRTARSSLLPKLQLSYGAQEVQGQSGFFQYQAGITIPLIFNKEHGQIQSARISQKIAEQEQIQVQMEITAAYQQATENYQKWQHTWNYYSTQALQRAQEQRDGAWLAYREGEIGYVAFLQNSRDAMQIEMDAWNAFEKYLASRFELEYLMGQ